MFRSSSLELSPVLLGLLDAVEAVPGFATPSHSLVEFESQLESSVVGLNLQNIRDYGCLSQFRSSSSDWVVKIFPIPPQKRLSFPVP